MRLKPLRFLFALVLLSLVAEMRASDRFDETDFTLDAPAFFIKGADHSVEIHCTNLQKLAAHNFVVSMAINGVRQDVHFTDGKGSFNVNFDRVEPFSVKADGFTYVRKVNPIPLWLGVLPPLLVIVLALVFKEVVSSLLVGVYLGAAVIGYYTEGFIGIVTAFFRIIDTYIIDSLLDRGHLSVIVFSVLIGGLVTIISKNGGMQAIVARLSRRATTPKRGQLVTWFLGLAIFFDDYANTLVVGNTMRPLTDKLRISREKLSYIVDSTAAPVAAIALITTWIGAELGYIQGALATVNGTELVIEQGAYSIFLSSLQYSFYPILTIIFILLLVLMKRDYGPMFKAESLARRHGVAASTTGKKSVDISEFEPVEGILPRSVNALVPIAVVILGTVAGLLITGYDTQIWNNPDTGLAKKLSETIGNSDSYLALLWASMGAVVVAIFLTVVQGLMSFGDTIETALNGFKTMINAVVILILAWSLATVTEQLHTADYLASLASENVAPWAIPVLTFFISAIVSFSTGSAWGTMAIVYPLMLPLSWGLSMKTGLDTEAAMALFCNTTSAVLAGAVLGDHCSPISDTTILSSLATQCDHIAHVNTQIPYAITVGITSMVLSTLTAIWDIPWYLGFPLGVAALFGVIQVLGRSVDSATP